MRQTIILSIIFFILAISLMGCTKIPVEDDDTIPVVDENIPDTTEDVPDVTDSGIVDTVTEPSVYDEYADTSLIDESLNDLEIIG